MSSASLFDRPPSGLLLGTPRYSKRSCISAGEKAARSGMALDFSQHERVMLPKGVVATYRMRIAYFDVTSRQAPPKAAHFSWTCSASSPPIASTSLKATASTMAACQPGKANARIRWATDQMAGYNLGFPGFRQEGCPAGHSFAPEQTKIDII